MNDNTDVEFWCKRKFTVYHSSTYKREFTVYNSSTYKHKFTVYHSSTYSMESGRRQRCSNRAADCIINTERTQLIQYSPHCTVHIVQYREMNSLYYTVYDIDKCRLLLCRYMHCSFPKLVTIPWYEYLRTVGSFSGHIQNCKDGILSLLRTCVPGLYSDF